MDSRFRHASSDPRFKKPSKRKTKFSVDARFLPLFDHQSDRAKVDKRGKVLKNNQSKELDQYYNLGDDKKNDYARGEALLESSGDETNSDEESAHEAATSTSESDDVGLGEQDSDELDVDLDEVEPSASKVEVEEAAPLSEQISHRLALVNLDWDHLSSVDIHALCSSLLSPTATRMPPLKQMTISKLGKAEKNRIARGKVEKVAIYVSKFGKERMKQEECQGPVIKETLGKVRDSEDMDILRAYQLERLRFFYAVVTCDNARSAQHLYTELDGTEIERSANVVDMRYIPDDMTFDDVDVRDAITSQDFDLASYEPIDFVTDSLRHSKVKLTWDDDDPERKKKLAKLAGAGLGGKKLTKTEMETLDVQQYIAPNSSEEEDTSDEVLKHTRRMELRKLLGVGDETQGYQHMGEENDAVHMEVTFAPALSGEVAGEKEETSLETYRRKEMERKQLKRVKRQREHVEGRDDGFFESGEEVVGEKGGSDDSDSKHFDMKHVIRAEKGKMLKSRAKKRRKLRDVKEDSFRINVDDSRFASLHSDYNFAIDPSNPLYQKSKNMERLLEERGGEDEAPSVTPKLENKGHKAN
ncbi:hypothetical protein BT69DRAFT_1354792 [Atractiella rhizophila]|nr:hypothetical protein BT69DRAFT_1354792 [Atractiella rhizophila]